ncbi:ABC transporter permease [Paenibacillus alvei]|uniref:ABC transporter permease n=1 Tax=Paenibacillus alvei TaxID=44250 RepID=UPI00227F87AB|nr:ABC-2 family transporter protein [Paenibacillus alvei]
MLKYMAIAKGEFLSRLSYRVGAIFTSLSNILFLLLTYYLWRAIYNNDAVINGMNFNQTILYLTMASTLFYFYRTNIDWKVSLLINTGDLACYMTKPLNLQLRIMFQAIGLALLNFFTSSLPAILVISLLLKFDFPVSSYIPYFFIAAILAFLITFNVDYTVGIIAFYTESIWGINAAKEAIVLMLSGALIPLNFFPNSLRFFLEFVPFQAIYHTPMKILTDPEISAASCVRLISIQFLWVFLLFLINKILTAQALKSVKYNGG